MSNDLDRLLEQVEDALEDGEEQLWQPDLTDLVLPSSPTPSAGEGSQEDSSTEGRATPQDALQEQMMQNFLDELPAGQGHSEPLQPESLEGHSLTDVQIRQRRSRTQTAQAFVPAETEAQTDLLFRTGGRKSSASSPALLEQLQQLEGTQASLQALSRSQTASGTSLAGAAVSRPGSSISYDPAVLGDTPLAAAAAAAQEENQARAVDRAFQRDSRRYDRGFSLY